MQHQGDQAAHDEAGNGAPVDQRGTASVLPGLECSFGVIFTFIKRKLSHCQQEMAMKQHILT
jgi:hypothetical protein